MSDPKNAPSAMPRAHRLSVCADCGERLKESERPRARRCASCACAMHAECGMIKGSREVCEACYRAPTELDPAQTIAVEDAHEEVTRVKNDLERAVVRFTKPRGRFLELGARVAVVAGEASATSTVLAVLKDVAGLHRAMSLALAPPGMARSNLLAMSQALADAAEKLKDASSLVLDPDAPEVLYEPSFDGVYPEEDESEAG